jgi:hypothetical protein
MHIRAFGMRATIVLRDEFLSWKVLRDAKSMGTAALYDKWYDINDALVRVPRPVQTKHHLSLVTAESSQPR